MTSFDVPRNQAQLPAGINATQLGVKYLQLRTTGNVNTGGGSGAAYIVPAGKSAIVKGGLVFVIDSYGSLGELTFGFLDVSASLFVKIGKTLEILIDPVDTKVTLDYELLLDSGDRLGFDPADSANNATNDFTFNIDEFDV